VWVSTCRGCELLRRFLGTGSCVGVDFAAVGVGQGDCAFGVAGDCDVSVVVLAVIVIAQINHVLGISDPIGAVVEEVVCLGFADAGAVGDAAGSVAMRKVSVLPPVCVICRG
jgi:hypothetical protein